MNQNHHHHHPASSSFPRYLREPTAKQPSNNHHDSWASDLSVEESYPSNYNNHCSYESHQERRYGRQQEQQQQQQQNGHHQHHYHGKTVRGGSSLLDDEPSKMSEQQSFMSYQQKQQQQEHQYHNNYDYQYQQYNYSDNHYSHQSNSKPIAIVSPHEERGSLQHHFNAPSAAAAPSMTSPVRRNRSSGEDTVRSFLSPRTMSIYERCFEAMEQKQNDEPVAASSAACAVASTRPANRCSLPSSLPFSDSQEEETEQQEAQDDIVEIEISPNEFRLLRGSTETLAAFQAGRCQIVQCFACDSQLRCINDCEMVVCPDCRIVSPIFNLEDSSNEFDHEEEKDVKIGTAKSSFDDHFYAYSDNDEEDFGARESHRMMAALSIQQKEQQQQQDHSASYGSIPDTVVTATSASSNCTGRNSTRSRTVEMVRYGVGLGVKLQN